MNTNTNKIKLSDKQKEVIRLMREGRQLSYSRFIGYSAIAFSNPTLFVNKHTVYSLQDKGIIEIDKHLSLSSHSYRLTEFSKTIKL
jgi:hypothetical protein